MPKIIWKTVNEEPPDNTHCWLTGNNRDHLFQGTYKAAEKVWIDLFATPEAGALYSKANGITHWLPETDLDMEFPEEATP